MAEITQSNVASTNVYIDVLSDKVCSVYGHTWQITKRYIAIKDNAVVESDNRTGPWESCVTLGNGQNN